mmetsp:Transcript_12239/g.27164  ORF Transcript_12239/g.27164 Transcript_12239/m.27164 type:complete len:168 (+) Transcript_12239:597-1100(+)
MGLCCLAEPRLGSLAAGWGAVTVCVVTGLETDFHGEEAALRGALRILGTATGGLLATLCGRSWPCAIVWAAGLAFLKRRLQPSHGYFCIVAALTYAVVGLSPDVHVGVRATALMRCAGVALGVLAIVVSLALRSGVHGLWWHLSGERAQGQEVLKGAGNSASTAASK